MKLAKIIALFLLSVLLMPSEVMAIVNDKQIVIPKYKRKSPQAYETIAVDATIYICRDEFSLDFSTPQGIAEISICDEWGKETESFTASTDAPIVWYMTDYEGYTITITTEYAEYVAEL